MRILVLLILVLPLPLLGQSAQVGPRLESLRVGLSAPAPSHEYDQLLAGEEFARTTPRWVWGGAIGAVVGALAMVGVASVVEGFAEQDVSYLRAAGIGAFGGFVIGSLIAGS